MYSTYISIFHVIAMSYHLQLLLQLTVTIERLKAMMLSVLCFFSPVSIGTKRHATILT